MKNKSLIHGIVFFSFMIAVMSGCAAAKISSANLQAIKTMQPPAGKALVYVIRPQSLGYALHFTVMCDDKKIGAISGGH